MIQQPLLAPQAPAVAAQIAVGADHAVTRHDDRKAVVAVGATDGSRGARAVELVGELRVGRGVPVGDLQEPPLHCVLEGRARHDQRNREARQRPGEVAADLIGDRVEVRVAARHDRAVEAPA